MRGELLRAQTGESVRTLLSRSRDASGRIMGSRRTAGVTPFADGSLTVSGFRPSPGTTALPDDVGRTVAGPRGRIPGAGRAEPGC
ncbi:MULTISPECIES: hypothetical protein [unclassified Streptosporangium]|uniref:hypothetical protein n=1 Tax=unclassified Streptosporangium TaxID=2632669 RepID=UPI002E2958F6|nr:MULTISPECIES: hypothetical protein [unclassified Streptosporangium]